MARSRGVPAPNDACNQDISSPLSARGTLPSQSASSLALVVLAGVIAAALVALIFASLVGFHGLFVQRDKSVVFVFVAAVAAILAISGIKLFRDYPQRPVRTRHCGGFPSGHAAGDRHRGRAQARSASSCWDRGHAAGEVWRRSARADVWQARHVALCP